MKSKIIAAVAAPFIVAGSLFLATAPATAVEVPSSQSVLTYVPQLAPTPPTEEQLASAPAIPVAFDGENLSVTVPTSYAGQDVYGYAFSTPVPLGWSEVSEAGAAQFRVTGAALPAGDHTLAVLDSDGNIIGAGGFTLTSDAGPVFPETSDDSGIAETGADAEADAITPTGGDMNLAPIAIGAGALILAGVVIIVGQRNQRRKAQIK